MSITTARPPTAALSAAAKTARFRTTRIPVQVFASFHRWRPVVRQVVVRPAVAGGCQPGTEFSAWAGRCSDAVGTRPSSEAFRQGWGSWGSVWRELEEGTTGLMDPSPFTRHRGAASRTHAPRPLPFDVLEQPDNVVLLFDLPGVARSDVQLTMSPDSILTISVERQAPKSTPPQAASTDQQPPPTTAAAAADAGPAEGEAAAGGATAAAAAPEAAAAAEMESTVVRLERPYGRFVRRIRLPKGVDAEGITAKLQDGVLALTVPKLAKQQPAALNIAVE